MEHSLLLFASILFQIALSAWSHSDQESWPQDYPMCGTADQSPINILSELVIYDESVCLPQFDWELDASVNTFRILNDGHTIL